MQAWTEVMPCASDGVSNIKQIKHSKIQKPGLGCKSQRDNWNRRLSIDISLPTTDLGGTRTLCCSAHCRGVGAKRALLTLCCGLEWSVGACRALKTGCRAVGEPQARGVGSLWCDKHVSMYQKQKAGRRHLGAISTRDRRRQSRGVCALRAYLAGHCSGCALGCGKGASRAGLASGGGHSLGAVGARGAWEALSGIGGRGVRARKAGVTEHGRGGDGDVSRVANALGDLGGKGGREGVGGTGELGLASWTVGSSGARVALGGLKEEAREA